MHLAIDTATATASLAIARDGQVLAELSWHCGQNHSVELMPHLQWLLKQSGLELSAITSLSVTRGPGSYNGLRVGISTAKGLAFSLGVPLVGIGTLEAAAFAHAEAGLPVCPLLNAGRGEVACAIYQQNEGRWLKLTDEHITTMDRLCSRITKKTIFCGELTPAAIQQLKQKLGAKANIASPVASLRRAGYLAELGLLRLKAGENDPPASLQPIYLRRPQITQPRTRWPR